jgi:hypothetical protein
VILRSKPAVALLPVGSVKPKRTREEKRDETCVQEKETQKKISLMPESVTLVAPGSIEQMMLEMVRIRIATGVTRGFERLLYCDMQSEWKNYHIFTFPGWSLSKNRENCEILHLIKKSGGKLIHHSDLGKGGGEYF